MNTHVNEEKIEQVLTEFVQGVFRSELSQFLIDHFEELGVDPERL